jgi:hypothetical protein
MFLAGTNLTMVYFGYKQNFKKISGNKEFRFYGILCLIFIIVISLALRLGEIYPAASH